jgi:hypothetical protein
MPQQNNQLPLYQNFEECQCAILLRFHRESDIRVDLRIPSSSDQITNVSSTYQWLGFCWAVVKALHVAVGHNNRRLYFSKMGCGDWASDSVVFPIGPPWGRTKLTLWVRPLFPQRWALGQCRAYSEGIIITCGSDTHHSWRQRLVLKRITPYWHCWSLEKTWLHIVTVKASDHI